ncbi:transcriptional regulator [Metallosphaera tengchongensis]|uniref:Transcriptional regulator n=2 Tax=Metallosphaera tengchongensis TaxID=1532350 RepID=A0A6N0P011_9CREN|nr:transcriptional regulator [Metallosphaera tengchongensis]
MRSVIATKLVKDKGYPLYRAALVMGVTPAAVANYMNGKRGTAIKSMIEKDQRLMEMIGDLVDKMASSGSTNQLATYYCILCAEGKRVLKRNGISLPSCLYESNLMLK